MTSSGTEHRRDATAVDYVERCRRKYVEFVKGFNAVPLRFITHQRSLAAAAVTSE